MAEALFSSEEEDDVVVSVSCLQIYNEKVKDLLVKQSGDLQMR